MSGRVVKGRRGRGKGEALLARLTGVAAAGEADEGGGTAAAAPAGSPPGLAGVAAAAGPRGRVVDGHLAGLRGGALLALAVLRLHVLQEESRGTAAGHRNLPAAAAARRPRSAPALLATPLSRAAPRVAVLFVCRGGAGLLLAPRSVVWVEMWVAAVEGRCGGGGGGGAGGRGQHAHLVGGCRG